MALKIAPASPEEHAFAAEVNKKLPDGARISAYELVDSESVRRSYGLTFSYGSKRTTIQADSPFHYDGVEDVVKRVQDWIAGLAAGNRWSTDLRHAE